MAPVHPARHIGATIYMERRYELRTWYRTWRRTFSECARRAHQFRMNHMPALLLPGMTVTNEPGVYKSGKYGVRTENTMLIVDDQTTDFDKFYKFEALTLCPIDLKPVLPELLSSEEKVWLNDYHQKYMPHSAHTSARKKRTG